MPMATPITMPRLGLSMVEGTVIEWHVKAGDPVEKDQPVLTIESEKAQVEVEAFGSGVLAAIYTEAGRTVPIGELLGVIVSPGEQFDPAEFAKSFVPERGGAPSTATEEGATDAIAGATSFRSAQATPTKAAPAARALAKRLGVDLGTVQGSGPGGRILPEDVERAARSHVEVNGIRLGVEVAGEGRSIALIEGYAVDRSSWQRQIDVLAAGHRVIAWDHRGVSGSRDDPNAPLTIAVLADDAAALLDHLQVESAIVVGASMGAAVALELARVRPTAVGALLLLSPVFAPDPRLEAVIRSWAEADGAEDRARAMLPWIVGRDFLADVPRREAAASALRAMAGRIPAPTLRRHQYALLDWLGSAHDELRSVTIPVRILAGDDDLLAPPATARRLCQLLPNGSVEILEGAGHALMIEREDVVTARIRELAQRVS